MKKLTINLENCYGIKKLYHTFDFEKSNVFMIYAPNGVMKSSFARTFLDLSNGGVTKDLVFKERITVRDIKDDAGENISPEEIFVIEPYNESFNSNKISTLLVNEKLKNEYDKIYDEISNKKDILLKVLKNLSGLKNDTEEELSQVLANDPKEFFKALTSAAEDVADDKYVSFAEIKYHIIFNDKVLPVIESDSFRESLKKYIQIFDSLTSSSTFFKKGVFNHNNAADTARSLENNGYFKANHGLIINGKERKELNTQQELEQVIQAEKEIILNNEDLVKSFEDIDKKLTKNQDLKNFRSYLEKNQHILNELDNLELFRKKIWTGYFSKSKSEYSDLMTTYNNGKVVIEQIVSKAKEESTRWREVIDIFNQRFSVPFILKMENQDDVILKSEVPNIKFEFKDDDGSKVNVEKEDLISILSSGEKRALYILNIIFEIEARLFTSQKTIFIIDDIADSFDYKNKYAIVQYLKDITFTANFYQIILSHNFDFYRTICGRLDTKRTNKLHAIKTPNGVILEQEKYQKNPFDAWKNDLDNNKEMLIASIPFVRNLSEYCGIEDCYLKLTSLLHFKKDTDEFNIQQLQDIYHNVLQDKKDLSSHGTNTLVKSMIYSLSNEICLGQDESMDLEKKIVLSIAIRLCTEEFMVSEINDIGFVESIQSNQTYKLIRKFKELYPDRNEQIALIELVNLMTPENIHLNSFMYEPILDMSAEHLRNLYKRVKEINTLK